MSKIQAVKGMNDILPAEVDGWNHALETLKTVLQGFAYQEIKLPLVEFTHLFKRSIGDVTDIVSKEMYTFADLNGEFLSLRPEGTAGCVRAAIEHGLLRQQQKLWYFGPMFRHERPQKGRYRQFYQLGVEVFGSAEPAIDLEILLMSHHFWSALALKHQPELQINCLGVVAERHAYKQDLITFFQQHLQYLSEDEKLRLERNPLRLLDSKAETIQELLVQAPKLIDYISASSRQHFEQICQGLEALHIPYQVNPYLVRGLDYYNDLVFEWVSNDLGSQATVCAGGRYNALVELLGGPAVPAVGFALGFERLLLLMGSQTHGRVLDVYMITQEAQPLSKTHVLAQTLREKLGLKVEVSPAVTSLKSQFKKADKSGALMALILGPEELEKEQITIKYLRQGYDEKQVTILQQDLTLWMATKFGEQRS